MQASIPYASCFLYPIDYFKILDHVFLQLTQVILLLIHHSNLEVGCPIQGWIYYEANKA